MHGLRRTKVNYKFNEENLIKEFKKYVDQTYDQHYATDKYQATDIIIDSGHGTGFCLGNVIKYAKRYGRKGNVKESRKDLMKILHYALIQLYIHDEENKSKFESSNSKVQEYYYPTNYNDLEYDVKLNVSIDDATPEDWNKVSYAKRR